VQQAPPQPPRKRGQWGWWVLLAVILAAVLVAGVVVIAKMVGTPAGPSRGSAPQTNQPVPDRQTQELTAYPAESASTGSNDDGQQGIMTTPWTEWNGTQR
jgi:serine/threonine-protein kinase